jgi:hypothetical protein
MKLKTLTAIAVAGAFALPYAAHAADSERLIVAQAGGAPGAGPVRDPVVTPPAPPAGQPTPERLGAADATAPGQQPEFGQLDRDRDGQISRQEWDQYWQQQRGAATGATQPGAAAGATQPGTTQPGATQPGATAGPGLPPSSPDAPPPGGRIGTGAPDAGAAGAAGGAGAGAGGAGGAGN